MLGPSLQYWPVPKIGKTFGAREFAAVASAENGRIDDVPSRIMAEVTLVCYDECWMRGRKMSPPRDDAGRIWQRISRRAAGANGGTGQSAFATANC